LLLVFDILWVGLGYGGIDALLLNIMPVAAILFASLLYHLGYPESRSRRVGLVLIGNISANPLEALVSHAIIAAAAGAFTGLGVRIYRSMLPAPAGGSQVSQWSSHRW
jgi:hypothetical protein